MRQSRPSFMEHLPPLDAKPMSQAGETSSGSFIVKPKIIDRGGLTLATPVSEVKFYRRTSDLIANKYTPQAQNLNIHSIGDFNRGGLPKFCFIF